VARSGTTFAFLAFGVAALLYLVVEELLLEAHHIRHHTSRVAATFFLGFLIILLAEGAGY
jgi:ZIP family zinc transporter